MIWSLHRKIFHQARTWSMILRYLVKRKNPLHFWKACRSPRRHLYSWICWRVVGVLILPSFLSCKWGLMYVGSFLSLVASGDKFKANQLQIKHDLLATHLLACRLTINHLIWCHYVSLPYFLNSILFMLTCPIYIHFKFLVFYLAFSLYS
jgi:hypothetical protein